MSAEEASFQLKVSTSTSKLLVRRNEHFFPFLFLIHNSVCIAAGMTPYQRRQKFLNASQLNVTPHNVEKSRTILDHSPSDRTWERPQ